MKVKAENPITQLEGQATHPLIEVYFEFAHLKQLFRQGWLHSGIPAARCESVAEHSLGVAVLALLLAESHFSQLNLTKTLKMALIHDLGEIYAGDITPHEAISPEEKYQRELAGIRQIFNRLPNGAAYIQIWQEFEAGQSPEARFIRQIDRLEMALQAGVYEQQNLGDLSQFFTSAQQAISAPQLNDILDHLQQMRPK